MWVTLSPGRVICLGCSQVMEGGTEKERMLWKLNHDCRPPNLEELCGACGGACGPIFCWEDLDVR